MKYTIDTTVKAQYLDDFFCALSKVELKYVLYHCKNNEPNVTDEYKYPERVFAYEFYHQYRSIMEEKAGIYCGLYLNGEQPKSSQVWEGLSKITPDIVLHGKVGEHDATGESQKWLCEIKMTGNPYVKDDLVKMTNNESILKFQNYIFLYVGATLQNLKDKLDGCNERIDGNILCICAFYDEYDVQISCRRYNEIINNQKCLTI